MPSVEITISGWWVVALVVQIAWVFLVVRPAYDVLERRHRRWLRADNSRERWFRRATLFVAGPLLWILGGLDQIDQWKVQRHNRKMREARGE